MVNRFEFSTAARIIFGAGVVQEVGAIAHALGTRALIVTGRDPGRSARLDEPLRRRDIRTGRFSFAGEPTVGAIRSGVALARAMQADLVIAFGGGSALDGGKAIAAMVPNSGEPADYLEIIGQGRPLEQRPLPCIAIPTTAGTGSEATRNAVLLSPEHGVKASLRHAWMLPEVALVDPELTLGLPPEITACTGLDALTQLIEPFLSLRANPVTDTFCLEGVRRVAGSLRRAWQDGHDLQAREDMALASLLGGMALANAGLGAVHGLAAPLGGRRPIPHGAACAALLPHVLAANLQGLRAQAPHGSGLARFSDLARALTGDRDAEAEDGLRWVRSLTEDLGIRGLGSFGFVPADLEEVAEKAERSSSMQANPVKLTREGLVDILAKAL